MTDKQDTCLESIFALQTHGKDVLLTRHPVLVLNRDVDALCTTTALASICVSQPGEFYAVGRFIQAGNSYETIVICGSRPAPQNTRSLIEQSVLPLLRQVGANPDALKTDSVYESTMKTLFSSIARHTYQNWKQLARLDCLKHWDSIVSRKRQLLMYNYKPVLVKYFDELLELLQHMKRYAANVNSDFIDDFDEFFVLNTKLHLFLTNDKLDLFESIDNVHRNTLKELLNPDFPIVEDGGVLTKNRVTGGLPAFFSFAQYSVNLVANYRRAAQLLNKARSRSDVFRGPPEIVFYDPTFRTVPINPYQALCDVGRLSFFRAMDVCCAIGYPHAALTLFDYLLSKAVSTPGVFVLPIIGCSAYLCRGCSVYIDSYSSNYSHICDSASYVPTCFIHMGTSGNYIFPWVAPDVSRLGKEFCDGMQDSAYASMRKELQALADRFSPGRMAYKAMKYLTQISAFRAPDLAVSTYR